MFKANKKLIKVAQNNHTNAVFMKCETEAEMKVLSGVKALHTQCKLIKWNKFVAPAFTENVLYHMGALLKKKIKNLILL